MRSHLEDLQELLGETEAEILLKRDDDKSKEREDAATTTQLLRAMRSKVVWCHDGLSELHSCLAEMEDEVEVLKAVATGKEEQIRQLEAEKGDLMEKVHGLQQQNGLLTRLAGAGKEQGEELLACLREKCERVEALQEEVRRGRRSSIIDDRDELIEKVGERIR